MNRKTLKYVVAIAICLIACKQAGGCPTCVGKSMLGMERPFFKVYRPHRSSTRATEKQAMSLRKTNTMAEHDNDKKQELRKEEA